MPPYTSPGDYIINIMHSKEKPDAAEIRTQNELYNAYDTYLRKGVKDEISAEMSRAVPLDNATINRLRGSTFGQQCRQLLVRAFKNMFRNKHFVQARIAQTICIAVVLDILFFRKTSYGTQDVRSKNSVIIFITISQFMDTLESVVLSCTIFVCSRTIVVPLERGLFLREYANRMYGAFSYYLSKTAVELPYQLIMPIFFAVMVYWAIGLRNTAECFWIFGTPLSNTVW